MKKLVPFMAVALAASFAFAEDGDSDEAAENKEEAVAAAKPKAQSFFTALPFCRKAEFPAEVRVGGSADWTTVEEGRFYPLGSAFRTRQGGLLTVAFGAESTVTVSNDASFATRPQALGAKSRTLADVTGEVGLSLAKNLPAGAFSVALPGFTVKDLAGESRIVRELTGDGDSVTVRCVTGSLGISGRHFDIPAMHAADEVRIRSTHDNLETILYGTSGDYVAKLDQGVKAKAIVGDDGSVKESVAPSTLDWHLTPKTKVQINRAVPAIGERMSVAIMTFDIAGELKNNFAYAEGRAEVNSGELVKASKAETEELAKRAAEAAETTTSKVDADEEDSDEEKSSDNENKNNESSDKE